MALHLFCDAVNVKVQGAVLIFGFVDVGLAESFVSNGAFLSRATATRHSANIKASLGRPWLSRHSAMSVLQLPMSC